MNTKYPRTFHLPFSPGLGSDDRYADIDWDEFFSKILVLTEKLDGENTALMKSGVYARSHVAPTEHPWNKNMWMPGGVYDQVKHLLDDDMVYYGENLYGVHSIEYENLSEYFHIFAVRHKDEFLGWEDVDAFAALLGFPTVPVCDYGIGKFRNMQQLKAEILELHMKYPKYGTEIEGIVVRNYKAFDVNVFQNNVVKYVRAHHVQTDQHWRKNWKKATLTIN